MGKGTADRFAAIFSTALILAPLPLYASTPDIAGEDAISAAELEPDFQNGLFPEPDSLRPNVNFWVDVYTKYDENQAIIHDSVNLDIRYETIDLDEAYPRASRRYAARQLTLRKRQIADTLNRLARQGGRCENDAECRIAALFGNTTNAGVYRDAADQLRVQYGLKSRFKQGLVISGQYMPEMRKIFERYGVPLDLLALPHVESSFNVKAYSRVGAAGIWQFMRSTGRHYMKINGQTDERRDPLIATEGAAKFLRDNYVALQSWPLVVTSYNHGKNGMANAKRIHGDDIAGIIANYDGRAFGFASRNFYCEFLAARRIIQNPEQYFGNIDFHSPLEFDVVKLQHHMRVADLARQCDIKEIARLNPALHKNSLTARAVLPRGYALRVPRGGAAAVAQITPYNPTPDELAQTVPVPRPDTHSARGAAAGYGTITPAGEYVVDSGDSLFSIAQKHGVTVAALKELNGMGRRSRIFPGQKLALPAEAVAHAAPPAPQPAVVAAAPVPAQPAVPAAPAAAAVKERSVMADYAALFNYMAARVAALIGGGSQPQPAAPAPVAIAAAAVPAAPAPAAADTRSQPVSYPVPPPVNDKFRFVKTEEGYGVISVLPEETLAHYAEWAGIPIRDIVRFNKWGRPRLKLWGSVKIPLDKAAADAFERRRIEFHQSLYKDFFVSHSVKEVDDRVLHRGQSAWAIWHGQRDVPLWLISLYNEGKQLNRLQAGDILRVPVIEKKAF